MQLTPEEQRQRANAQWTPEARAAQSARMKERHAKKKSPASGSPPSKPSRQSSAAPTPLPSQAERSRLGDEMFDRMMAQLSQRLEPEQTTTKKTERLLPDDWDEREKCLRLAKLPARIPVEAVDQLCRVFDLLPLSQAEREEGVDAWAALFWQLGLFRNGYVLVALWLFGVAVPRFAEGYALSKQNDERRAKGLAPVAPKRAREEPATAPQSPPVAVQHFEKPA